MPREGIMCAGNVRSVIDPAVATFIQGLPKAELHLHLQGAASVETVLGLSRRYPDVGLPLQIGRASCRERV